MTQRLLLTGLCLTALFGSGCLFSKKTPKENPSISGSVEESFRARWVEKRAAEIAAKGTAPDAARTQAEAEFRERYVFNNPIKK